MTPQVKQGASDVGLGDEQRKARNLALALAVAGSILFVATSLAVSYGLLDGPDVDVDQWVISRLRDLRGPGADLSALGSGLVAGGAAVAGAAMALRSGAMTTAFLILAFSLLGGQLVEWLKDYYARPFPMRGVLLLNLTSGDVQVVASNSTARQHAGPDTAEVDPRGTRTDPRLQNYTVPATFPTGTGRAYPSGHTMGALSWALALVLATRAANRSVRIAPWTLVLSAAIALAVGVGRVMVRSHWASDVVASWGLAAALLGLAILADDAIRRRWPGRKTAKRPAG